MMDMCKRNFKQQIIGIASKVTMPFIRLYWFFVRPETHGVKCIVANGDEIVLLRHTYGKGRWTFPGGNVGKNESLEDAVRREIKEELGLDIINLTVIGNIFDTSEYVEDHIGCFVANATNKNFHIDTNEILEAGWYKLNNLPQPLPPLTKKILAMWNHDEIVE